MLKFKIIKYIIIYTVFAVPNAFVIECMYVVVCWYLFIYLFKNWSYRLIQVEILKQVFIGIYLTIAAKSKVLVFRQMIGFFFKN